MKRPLLRALAFLCVLLLSLLGVGNVLSYKAHDGLQVFDCYRALPSGSVDVLCLGSSHAYEGLNPAVLYERQGLSAYVLGSRWQMMHNTYYFLKEALLTQTPRLIVLDAYGCTVTEDYGIPAQVVTGTYGLRSPANRLAALRASAPEAELADYLFPLAQNHTRYAELSPADFLPEMGDAPYYDCFLGFAGRYVTTPHDQPDLSEIYESTELYPKTETYYRMTLELAQQHEIPVLVVVIPYSGISAEEASIYLSAESIAYEYGAEFINFNTLYEELEIDCQTDLADRGHLNYLGNAKLSNWLADWLRDSYDLPDRRGDPLCARWAQNAAYLKRLEQMETLKLVRDAEEYLARLCADSALTVAVCAQNAEGFGALPLPGVKEAGGASAWVVENGALAYVAGASDALPYHRVLAHETFAMHGGGAPTYDHQPLSAVKSGVTLFVYDSVTGRVVELAGLDAENGYALVHRTI